MLQIRNGVFETNSSSTHSICISKAPVKVPVGETIHFHLSKFGWENACVSDTATYLYTSILSYDQAYLVTLKAMLDELGVDYQFENPRDVEWWYVDHSEELGAFLVAVLNDKDMLARYLFGDSCIYTGNDNQDYQPDGCDIGKPTYWAYDNDDCWTKEPNPYHDPEHYDYFVKGN